jgi:hypothetical protein
VLTSILPGLRQVRAPLVSGYLLLIGLWLIFHSRFDDLENAGHHSQAIDTLGRLLGRPGELAVFAFVAYLVGSLNTVVADWALRRAGQATTRRNGPSGYSRDPRVSERVFRLLTANASRRLRLRCDATWASASPEARDYFRKTGLRRPQRDELHAAKAQGASPADLDLACRRHLFRLVSSQIPYVEKRLLVAHPNLHAETDRLVAEAELRDSLLIPLPIAAIGLSMNLSLPLTTRIVGGVCLIALLVSIFFQARSQSVDGNSIVAHAVADGMIGTQSLDMLTDPPPRFQDFD